MRIKRQVNRIDFFQAAALHRVADPPTWKVVVRQAKVMMMPTHKPKRQLKMETLWLLLKEPKVVVRHKHKSKEHIAELGPFQHLLKHLIKIDPPKLK